MSFVAIRGARAPPCVGAEVARCAVRTSAEQTEQDGSNFGVRSDSARGRERERSKRHTIVIRPPACGGKKSYPTNTAERHHDL